MIDQQNLVYEQRTHAVNISTPKYMPEFAGQDFVLTSDYTDTCNKLTYQQKYT